MEKECGLNQAGYCGAEEYLSKDFDKCPHKGTDGKCKAKQKDLILTDIDI